MLCLEVRFSLKADIGLLVSPLCARSGRCLSYGIISALNVRKRKKLLDVSLNADDAFRGIR